MSNSKTYLNVPYAEKDEAKALGAKWDAANKKWYVPATVKLMLFSKWPVESTSSTPKVKQKNSGTSANKPSSGVMTYPKDKNFTAYSGEQPPWV